MYYCVPELEEVDYDPTLLSGYMSHVHAAIAALNEGKTQYRVDGEVTLLYPTRQAKITVEVEAGDSAPVCYWVKLQLNGTEPPFSGDVPREIGRVPLVAYTE